MAAQRRRRAYRAARVTDAAPPPRPSTLEDALLGTRLRDAHRLLPGVGLAAAIVAASAWAVSTGRSPLPTATLAIVIGLVLANSVRLGPAFKPGLDFCVKKVLRLGIVLVGIRLSLLAVAEGGVAALPAVAVSVAAGIAAALLLARRLGVSSRLGILAAASTGICGVTATLAVAPVVDAEEREVAYTVGCVTLYGLLGMLLYPFLAHALFGDHPGAAGLFLGTAIHETAQVSGAALAYRDSYDAPAAFDAAVVTKLLRNASLVVVVPILGWLHARGSGSAGRRVPLARLFPLFVLGFLGMALLRTIGDTGLASGAPLGVLTSDQWKSTTKAIERAATGLCLPAAMAALGLGIRFAALRELGLRPLLLGAGAATAVALAALAAASVAARI